MIIKLLTAMCIFVLPWVSSTAQAQGGSCVRGPVTCTVMTQMKTCNASLMCSGAYPTPDAGSRPQAASTAMWVVRKTGSQNVTGCYPANLTSYNASPATFNLSAMAATSAPATRECNWSWYSNSIFVARVEAGGGKVPRSRVEATGNVSIGTANGLPVELMGFSIGDQSGENTED